MGALVGGLAELMKFIQINIMKNAKQFVNCKGDAIVSRRFL